VTIFPLDVHAELNINGTWTDLIAARDVLHPDGIQISRGRSDEAGKVQPSTCNLSIIDPDGTYSNRNPRSAYFGQLGRNTQLRTYIGRIPSSATGGSSTGTTSHVAPSVDAGASGLLVCAWLADGGASYTAPGGMTDRVNISSGASHALVATKVVASGATGTQTATAGASTDYASATAVIYGTSITVQEALSGPGGTFNTSERTVTTGAGTQAGWWIVAIQGYADDTVDDMPAAPCEGEGGWLLLADSGIIPTGLKHLKVWARQVRVAGAQTVTFPAGLISPSSTDNLGVLLVISGVDWFAPRFHGEVPSWPPRWNVRGNAVFTPIEAAGVMRRLGQGATPLRSPLYREFTSARNASALVAYWPMEDGTVTTVFASATSRTQALRISGTLQPASSSDVPGSAPLPVFGAPVSLSANVPTNYTTGSSYVHMLVTIPAAGLTTGTHLINLLDTSATIYRWQLVYTTASGGSLNLQAVDTSLATVAETGATAFAVNGTSFWCYLRLNQIGGTLDFGVHIRKVSPSGAVADEQTGDTTSGTVTHGNINRIIIGSTGDLTDASIGHIAIGSTSTFGTTFEFLGGASAAAGGYASERAGRRMLRLAREQHVPLYVTGDMDDTTQMGPQRIDTLPNLLADCETADGGVLFEAREMLTLAYRPRTSMYNQAVAAALTYTGELEPPFEPTDDDQHIRNDVTVQRTNGSFAEQTLAAGPLSVLAPPDGVGVYDEQVTVDVYDDEQLDDIAAWLVYLGTVDAYRFPALAVNQRRLDKDGKDTLRQSIAAADIRDRLTVAGLPVWLPPDTIETLIEGYTETLDTKIWQIGFNCSPGAPWQLGVRDTARRDSGFSTLAANFISGTNTSMSVATSSGPLWTTDGSYVPFDVFVGGVRLTVTAISGASSPQTFTITVTPVNGINKTIPSGTEVHVWQPAVRGL
jgi:hypothetical protein